MAVLGVEWSEDFNPHASVTCKEKLYPFLTGKEAEAREAGYLSKMTQIIRHRDRIQAQGSDSTTHGVSSTM